MVVVVRMVTIATVVEGVGVVAGVVEVVAGVVVVVDGAVDGAVAVAVAVVVVVVVVMLRVTVATVVEVVAIAAVAMVVEVVVVVVVVVEETVAAKAALQSPPPYRSQTVDDTWFDPSQIRCFEHRRLGSRLKRQQTPLQVVVTAATIFRMLTSPRTSLVTDLLGLSPGSMVRCIRLASHICSG